MRNFLVLAMSCLACLSAEANEWRKLTPTSYLLAPAEDRKILASAGLSNDQISVNLIDISGAMCGESETSDLSAAGPYKVNGTNVKFTQACLNGTRVVSPTTPEGKEFFTKAMTTGPATVELDLGIVLHFDSQGFEAVKKTMLETKSAL